MGKTPRAVYLIPEFDNPTGTVLSVADRVSLIRVAIELNLVLLEDNPYGMFRFEGDARPPLFALDTFGVVIYLGTYSKTLCPSVRVGYAVIPENLLGSASGTAALINEISERKSFLTVNTSQINQALVGGILLTEERSLARLVKAPLEFYRSNRDLLLGSLSKTFGESNEFVEWNRPTGGFFLELKLPFRFGREAMMVCASQHNVIVMPMSFFALDDSQDYKVRLSFSNVSPDEIATGVERFAKYVRLKAPELTKKATLAS